MKLKTWMLFSLVVLCFSTAYPQEKDRLEILKEEGTAIYERCMRIASQFYSLEEREQIKEITQIILESSDTKESLKHTLTNTGGRFFSLRISK